MIEVSVVKLLDKLRMEEVMNETRIVTDKHFVAPLTDEEYLELKVQAAKSNLKIKDWVSAAIREKLIKGGYQI